MMAQKIETSGPKHPFPNVRRFDDGNERMDDVMAVEIAWLRMKGEMEEERRQRAIMEETLQCLKGALRGMEQQVADARGETRKAETRISEERKQREVMTYEMDQLRERLSQAVDHIAEERSKGWLRRVFGR